jgi:hypothetical protein
MSVTISAGASQTVPLGSTLTNPSIIQVDWGVSSGNTQVYQNGSAQGVPVNVGLGPMSFTGVNGGGFYPGYIGEVLVFQPALTSVWRLLVTRYLGNRYGISVP